MTTDRDKMEDTHELLTVRIPARSMSDLDEIAEQHRTKSDAARAVVDLGLEAHDLDRRPGEMHEQLNKSLRERLSYSLQAVFAGSAFIVLMTIVIAVGLVIEVLTGEPLPPEFDTIAGIAILGILVGLVVVAVSGTIVVGRQLRQSIAGNV